MSAILGGADVIEMPRYFRPWDAGLVRLRAQLRTLDQQPDVRLRQVKARALLRQKMLARGLPPDEPVTMIMTGQGSPLLAVFDRDTLRLRALLRSDR
jgi:Fe2+ transport system protein FeoA